MDYNDDVYIVDFDGIQTEGQPPKRAKLANASTNIDMNILSKIERP